jgi:hypothetical protein
VKVVQVNAPDLEKQARCLMSVACLVNNAAKHDELQKKAQELLAQVAGTLKCQNH